MPAARFFKSVLSITIVKTYYAHPSAWNEIGFGGFCLAEIPPSDDPIRVMRYFRALWLAYQPKRDA